MAFSRKIIHNPGLLIPGHKAPGPVKLDPTDSINTGLLHFWDFRDGGKSLRDLAGKVTMRKHSNSSWLSTPKGRGLQATSSQEGTGGPAINIAAGADWAVVFHMWVTSVANNFYFGEFGTYTPGFSARGSPLGPAMYLGGAREFTGISFGTLPSYQCIVYTRKNGIISAYNKGLRSPTTFSVSTGWSTAYVYNGGFGSNRISRTDLSLRFYNRALTDAEALRLSRDLNAGLIPANDAPFLFSVAGGPQNIPVGLVTETDSALSITPVKTIAQALGLASETDSALGITPTKALTVALGQAIETDSALTITPVKDIFVSLGVASEADSALTITPVKDILVALGLATEADSALSINPAGAQYVALGQSLETDSALSVTPVKTIEVALAQATETDAALAITPAKQVALGQSTETDSALSIAVVHDLVIALGLVTETDTALSITYSLPNIDEILQGCPSAELLSEIRTATLTSGSRTAEWECNL